MKLGHTSQDIKDMLTVVKNSGVEEVHLIVEYESPSLEEGISALKSSPSIKVFKYTMGQGDANKLVVDAISDLANNLPALESIVLYLSEKAWASELVVPLLQNVGKLKLKHLQLEEVLQGSLVDFTLFLKVNSILTTSFSSL
jgi:hypothetical protein